MRGIGSERFEFRRSDSAAALRFNADKSTEVESQGIVVAGFG